MTGRLLKRRLETANGKVIETELGMKALTVRGIIEATGGRVFNGNVEDAVFTGISIDSRTVKEGELFIAIKGQRFDGHDFVMDALRNASGAMVSAPPAVPIKGKTIIYVKNTLKALQDIAHYERVKSKVTLIGVTGTSGKTTTKELIASMIGVRHRVLKSSGNLNNHIGLPLSLMNINDEDEFAVMEMGASIKGDIQLLCDIAAPDYGVITNVGPGHLEGFGNIEAVRDTKLELYDAVKTIVLNGDDRFLMEGVANRTGKIMDRAAKKILTFGIDNKTDVYAKDITLGDRYSVFSLCLGKDKCTDVRINVAGRFNVYNVLAAASVCNALGMDISDIKKGIESFVGVPMRLEIKELLGATVISDVYNANPASMEEAVKELVRLRKGRAIAVLGDMLELGSYAEEAHRRLGTWMSGLPLDILIAVGPMMAKAAEEFSANGGKSIIVSDSDVARKALLDICNRDDTVLVKGSRSMNMEKVIGDNPGKYTDLCGAHGVKNAL